MAKDYDEALNSLDKIKKRIEDVSHDLETHYSELSQTTRVILSLELQKMTVSFADLDKDVKGYEETLKRIFGDA